MANGRFRYAVEHKQPACPECLNLLERPDYWNHLKPEEKFQSFNIFCSLCKVMVVAQFMTGRGDM